jgi:two-component system, OmpR family, phosphate regulon response regulator PhoB
MARVLIVDDDPDILRLVSYNISQAGFEVISASTGRKALEIAQKQHPDLIILDVMLPDVDGMEVCRTLRQQYPSRKIPIIMLTARGDEIDRVVGFELGADDYVAKPFSTRELVLRVKSILRRSGGEPSDVLHAANVDIYPERRQCIAAGATVTLTVKEFDLLYELMKARGNVLTRDTLMDRVWGYHGDATSRTLDTHVRRLRDKLGEAGSCVETVRGVGYRISGPPDLAD